MRRSSRLKERDDLSVDRVLELINDGNESEIEDLVDYFEVDENHANKVDTIGIYDSTIILNHANIF